VLPSPALAADFTVNDTSDAPISASAGGTCLSTLGTCTLRAAVQAADQSTGAITITIPAGTYTLTIPPSGPDDTNSGDLHIVGTVNLVGAGQSSTIIQNGSSPKDRIFGVQPGSTVSMSGITVRNGDVIGFGGGISNEGNLTLTAVTISGNSASLPGGGIDNFDGSLTLNGSTVAHNTAPAGGGIAIEDFGGSLTATGSRIVSNTASLGSGAFGGGIVVDANQSTVNLSHTGVNNNVVFGGSGIGRGGGIAISATGVTLTLTNAAVSGNEAFGGSSGYGEGGGIADAGNSGNTLSFINSTVSANSASAPTFARGGGISSSGGSSLINMLNSTVDGNNADAGSVFSRGGGIDLSGGDSASISNSTISGNSATASGGVTTIGGGFAVGGQSAGHLDFSTIDRNTALSGSALFNSPVSALTASNSIIAGNPATNCTGAIVDGGYNLDSGTTCSFTGTVDLSATDPGVGALQNNGGPTLTESPVSGSPVIDTANPTCPPPTTDQRGGARPFTVSAARCDIGSVEFGATPATGGGTISVLTATGVPVNGRSGGPLTATVANFTDSQATGNASDYGATISWGDGHTSTGQIIATASGGSVQGTNTYTLSGTYTITVTITKFDGASVTVTTTAHIVTHFTVEVKGWIPQALLVDPQLPVDGTPYLAASVVEPNCPSLSLSPLQVAITRVQSRFGGDGHVPYAGTWRGLETLDFDWDGSAIQNSVAVASTGITHRFKTYWIPGSPDFKCAQTGHAPTTDMHGRTVGSNSFVVEICCASGRDPLVPSFAPAYHVTINGMMKTGDELDYSYEEAGFPSLGVRVTRNSVVADTTIGNDASCLSASDVLGPGGAATLGLAFLLHQSGSRRVPRIALPPAPPRIATICRLQHLPIVIAALGSARSASSANGPPQPTTMSKTGLKTPTGVALPPQRVSPAGTTSGTSSTGAISGNVTNLSGSPIGGICAAATDPFGNAVTTVTTSSKGSYTITGLLPGAYQVRFEECAAGTHLTQWFNGKPVLGDADSVSVTAGQTTSGINASLGTGGTITGLVTNSGGSPLANICVHAQDNRGHAADSMSTGRSGIYSVGGLPTGSYLVSFSDCPATDYLGQYYSGASTSNSASPVVVTSGSNTPNINATLILGATITGTVTDTAGAPLNRMCVAVFNAKSATVVASGNTSSTGTYALDALPGGSYIVQFTDCNGGNHAPQWYNGKASGSTADLLTLTNGVTTSGINAKLATGAAITGTVTDGVGHPLAGACAAAQPVNGGSSGVVSTATGSSGAYAISSLATGSYSVEFVDCSGGNHIPQWYNGQNSQAAANAVSVTAGTTVGGVNGQLLTGGTIAGTVTAAGSAVANVCVGVQDLNQNDAATGTTDGSGRYTVTGLATGDYKVNFTDCLGSVHASQWFNGQPDFSSATAVHVTAGSATTGINAALTTNGSITGTVIDASSHPVADLCVSAQSTTTGAQTSTTTDPSGSYAIKGLTGGSYLVDFRSCSTATQGNVHQWYSNALDSSTATSVTVAPSATTSGINATLASGGSIAGTVTSASGSPLPNICVDAQPNGTSIAQPLGTVTDSAGNYSIPGIATGSYTVSFDDCTGGLHQLQYFNGSSDPSTASAVAVTAPNSTTGINATLASGGAVAGTVTDAGTGTPLPGICVDVYAAGAAPLIDTTTTAADGTYRIGSLPPAGYNVNFLDCRGGGHTTQWANNKPNQGAADVITLTAGQTTTGVNAALSP